MSRRNLVKSVIAVVIAGFILSASSYQQKDEQEIIGVWKCEKVELKDFSCTGDIDAEHFKASIQKDFPKLVANFGIVEFAKDGKITFQEEGAEQIGTYTLKDGKLILTGITLPDSIDYSLSDKQTMCWDIAVTMTMYDSETGEEKGVIQYIRLLTLKKQ